MPGITFLIGNGFDLNVGLKTRYAQFYEYYIKKYPNDFFSESMKRDIELWSDLEVALGKSTEQVPEGKENSFGDSIDLLEISLAEYLQREQERIKIAEDQQEDIAKAMEQYLVKFYQEFPLEHRRSIEKIIKGCRGEMIYSFISFNYTNVLDQCVETTRKHLNGNKLGYYTTANGQQYFNVLGNIEHIHGTLEREMILGVNDVEQIADKRFSENLFYRQFMIKEDANRRFAQNKIERVKELIDNSKIIIIFGMSIGETDRMWWRYIGQWLQTSDDHRLIIYIKKNLPERLLTARERFLMENKVLERFKELSQSTDKWESVENKIYIICYSNIFTFSILNDELQ